MADFNSTDSVLVTGVSSPDQNQNLPQTNGEFENLCSSDASNVKIRDESIIMNNIGRSLLEISLTSPDLVCMGSPDINSLTYEESPDFSEGARKDLHLANEIGINENCSVEDDIDRLKLEHELNKKELLEAKVLLEELKRENELKSRECEQAWSSLKALKDELMRKSMHVGSLAFAVEGQVKEKTRWFSSIRDLTRKLKILKMDHISLSQDASELKKYVAEMEDFKLIIQSTIHQHAQLHEDVKIKFLREVKEKKELYNKVLELKGNIRVFCRCRPMNAEEIAEGATTAVDFEGSKDGELSVKSNGMFRKSFKFDAIFTPEAEQADVFEETSPLATSVLDGYNVCVFAYGQTGTGKTFTMEGTSEERGVNYRTLEKLFQIVDERRDTFRYEISVSVLEVYNEQIRDLLALGSSQPGSTAKRLEIKQVGEGGHHVPGLVEARVSNVGQVWEVLRMGSKARAIGSTNSNEHSSRSHCMHCVMVKGENMLNGECTRSKLWLVDLAGSERVAKTEVQGERLKETQNINRSLSALGDVISALATKSPHVPFRNSKLTHLLQDSLGGDSKALMFVQISPNENDISETLCSLNFASRVRGIELGPARKQMNKSEIFRYKQLAEKLKEDLKSKDLQLKKLEDTNYGLETRIKDRDAKNRNLQEKIKELESQLLVERKLARQHVDHKIAEEHQQIASEPVRSPLAAKTLNYFDGFERTDQENVNRASAESEEFSFRPPSLEAFALNARFLDKENCPETINQTRRASSNLLLPASRRESLIPLPPKSIRTFSQKCFDGAEIVECLHEEEAAACFSPKEQPLRSRSKKASGGGSALRRSVQRRIHAKSSPSLARKVGVNVGSEKLRVSIGGKNGQRFLASVRRAATTKEATKVRQQNQREKERGWNVGTSTRTLV